MGGPALRCAAGKSNRARCFQRVALSTAPFFFLKGVLLFVLKGVLPVAGALQLLAFTARPNSVWHLARARPFPRWLRFCFGAHPAAYTHVA